MNPYLKQYKQTQMDTAPKEEILLMLYDGAVRFLHLAKEGFAEKNIEKQHNNMIEKPVVSLLRICSIYMNL